MVGKGNQVPLQVAGDPATKLVYTGDPSVPAMSLYGLNGGEIGGFNLEGGSLLVEASVGVCFKQLTITNGSLILKGSDAGVYHNVFQQITVKNGGVVLTGTSLAVNVAQNSFFGLYVEALSMDALRLESADNNDFYGTCLNGQGLCLTFCPPTATTLGALANRFHGLDGNGPIVAESPFQNHIFGLSHVNGMSAVGGTQAHRVVVI